MLFNQCRNADARVRACEAGEKTETVSPEIV